MSVEFNKEYELGDFAYFSNEKISAEEVSQEEYISTENMVVDRGGVEKASKLPSVSKFNSFQKTDTLFSNIRTYFRKVWMASFDGGASADVLVFRTKDENALDPAYLYYLISNKDFADYSVLTAKGVKMPRGDKTAMMQYKFLLPDPEKQLQYASALKSLDDKIENNRRMNETLEGMAQAIFKSWFVDFDPVHAKVEALKNGGSEEDARIAAMCAISGKSAEALAQLKSEHPERYAELAATADAFPSSFTDSDLGQIPEGWEAKELGKIIEPKKGKTITKKTVEPGNVPVVAGGLEPAYYHSTPNVTAPTITVSASGANAGFTRMYYEDIWASDCSYINKTQTEFVFSIYSLLKLRQEEIFSMQQGAAQPHIYPSDIMRLTITNPPENIWRKCEAIQSSFYEAIGNNIIENQFLAETRDALLPKLLSGEIDVSAVEIAEGEV